MDLKFAMRLEILPKTLLFDSAIYFYALTSSSTINFKVLNEVQTILLIYHFSEQFAFSSIQESGIQLLIKRSGRNSGNH